MRGAFWNSRGLNKSGRKLSLSSFIGGNDLDFVGIVETKKSDFPNNYLRSLSRRNFDWCFLPADGTAGGILLGFDLIKFNVSNIVRRKFTLSWMVHDKKTSFDWRVVVVYGSPHEEGKQDFLDELEEVMGSWSGPTLIGGDFNLTREMSDKSNGVINFRWADCFNSWINKWAIIELKPGNRDFTWTNNQDNLIHARIDRIFVTTEWDSAYPLSRVKALDKGNSDHTPLFIDLGEIFARGKKRFRFEKWWLEKEDFKEVVRKDWSYLCEDTDPMDVW